MPVQVAAPLAVLVSITVAVVVVIQDWRNVHVKSAGWLVLSTLFGIPLGLVLLKTVSGIHRQIDLGRFHHRLRALLAGWPQARTPQ